MVEPIGAIDSGHVEEVVVTEGGVDYMFAWFADANNEDLQREGKPPKFWRVPKTLRMARDPSSGDYMFRLLHYVGVRDEATHIGDTRDLAGGRLAFTVTTDPPQGVVEKAQEKLRQRLREQNPGGKYWRIFGRNADNPNFGLVPMSNVRVNVSNLGIDEQSGNTDADERALPGVPRTRLKDRSRPIPESRLAERDMRDDMSDLLWAQLDGEGEAGGLGGPVSVAGNISSDLAGVLWKDFETGSSSTVTTYMTGDLELYFPAMELTITGDWQDTFDHFSAAASGRKWWFAADIEVEVEKLMTQGTLDVDLTIDGTKPGADKLDEYVNKRIEFISKQFMEQAKKKIFEPAPPNVKPAKANAKGGFLAGLFGSGAFSLKKKYVERNLELEYHETRQVKYLKRHRIDGQLKGMYDEIQKDPEAKQKYFVRIDLTDWARKVHRVFTPVANWPSPEKAYVGDPVAAIFVSAGYPNADGNVDWNGRKFTADGPEDWTFEVARKEMEQVTNPPEGWSPEDTWVRRRIILEVPEGENENRFVKQYVEKREVDLDPPEGTLTSDLQLAARVDSVGKFELGPIKPFVNLEQGQSIELELQPKGQTEAGEERPVTRYVWTGADMDTETLALTPGYYERYTGDAETVPSYRYRVTVRTMGSIFSRGEQWTGPWEDLDGNGELLFSVPLKEDAEPRDVRNLTPEERAEGIHAIARRRRMAPEAPESEPGPVSVEVEPTGSGETTEVSPRYTGDASEETVSGYEVSGRSTSKSDDETETSEVWPRSMPTGYEDE
jgi:hypothetical protein